MVSFWPFRRNDTTSAASFEKTLSQLSTKINRYSTQLETFRTKQRRYKALLTLYAGFSYILVAAILVLVTGWDNWGAIEYTAVAGGPVAIIGLRWVLNAWYDYRIKSVQSRLQDATKEREKVIEKLKIATNTIPPSSCSTNTAAAEQGTRKASNSNNKTARAPNASLQAARACPRNSNSNSKELVPVSLHRPQPTSQAVNLLPPTPSTPAYALPH